MSDSEYPTGEGDWQGGWQPAPRDALFQVLGGYMSSQVLYVSAKLGVADHLGAGAKSSAELAAATGADPTSLHRVLRAGACLGLYTETEPGTFALTEVGDLLRTDAEKSMRSLVLLFVGEAGWKAWGNLLHSVRTGGSAFEDVFHMPVFEYSGNNPEVASVFNEAMAEDTRNIADHIVDVYDFTKFTTIADIGGGNGTLISAILKAGPELKGVLFDAAYGLEAAEQTLRAEGTQDRVQVVEGDFFKSVPEGADAYVMKAVVHDWNDERSIEILKSVRRAIPADGTLLLIEQVMPPKVDSPAMMGLVVSDLNLLVYSGGRERTEAEFSELLTKTGFELTSVSKTLGNSDFHVIEAKAR